MDGWRWAAGDGAAGGGRDPLLTQIWAPWGGGLGFGAWWRGNGGVGRGPREKEKKKGAGDAPVGRTDSVARIVLDGMTKLLGSSSFSRSRSNRDLGWAPPVEDAVQVVLWPTAGRDAGA